jgi:hypothetical protein
MTVKWAEWISSHGDFSAAGDEDARRAPRSIAGSNESGMGRVQAMLVPGKRTTTEMLTRGSSQRRRTVVASD